MHCELTVSEALRYTALLRLTGFTSDADADAQIEELLKTLGIQTVANCLIGSSDRRGISGGQRKRVNLAMELLANPPILYLDEPTSGLSSEDARRIMVLLRRLADTGKSIVLTIHQPDADIFRLVDQVAVIAKDHDSSSPGRLAYYGPAFPDAFQFFSPEHNSATLDKGISPGKLLEWLDLRPIDEWTQIFVRSGYYQTYVTHRSLQPTDTQSFAPLQQMRVGLSTQTVALLRRAISIKMSDRWNTLVLLVQAPVVAGVIIMVFGEPARQSVTVENWMQVNNAGGNGSVSGGSFGPVVWMH